MTIWCRNRSLSTSGSRAGRRSSPPCSSTGRGGSSSATPTLGSPFRGRFCLPRTRGQGGSVCWSFPLRRPLCGPTIRWHFVRCYLEGYSLFFEGGEGDSQTCWADTQGFALFVENGQGTSGIETQSFYLGRVDSGRHFLKRYFYVG